MQRFFSTFPGSRPGIGLLLLRIVVGGGATLQGIACLSRANAVDPLLWGTAVLAVVSGLAVVAGFVTPAFGVVAGLCIIGISTAGRQPDAPFIDRLAALILVADAAALALLGPGALSLDARLFGRREIVIPHDPRR